MTRAPTHKFHVTPKDIVDSVPTVCYNTMTYFNAIIVILAHPTMPCIHLGYLYERIQIHITLSLWTVLLENFTNSG